MKKNLYYIFYIVTQFLFGIYGFINAEKLAQEEFKMISESLPEVFTKSLSLENLISGAKVSAVIIIIISIILLGTLVRHKNLQRKTLTIVLLIGSILFSFSIIPILSIIALIMVFTDKSAVVEKKQKKDLPIISNISYTKKDYFYGLILILVYFGQILFVPLLEKVTNSIEFSSIFYQIIIFGITILIFKNVYKRDFKYLKSNFSGYFKNALKFWGIMYLVMFLVVAIQQFVFKAGGQSVNQMTLESLPIWYTFPLAVFFAPVVEEAIFRGVIRRFIRNDILFIVISSISFGLLHTLGSEESLYLVIVQSLNYVAMGSLLAYSYTKTNNIFTSMMVHAFNNFVAMLVIIFI